MPVVFGENTPTIKEVWLYTYRNMETRFDYRDRDVLKRLRINLVKSYTKDRLNTPTQRFEIISYSYPQYSPYSKVKGKFSKKQRKVKHEYQTILQIEELNWNSRFRIRIGSQRKWPTNKQIKWNQIKAVHSSIREKYATKYGKGTDKYKKALQEHRRKAKYLDVGDYISQVYGLNGDFYWRQAPLAKKFNCSFGLIWNKELPEDADYMFFGKHDLRIIEILLKRKIIKRM
jgi:hypothetical protein